jgi:predicted nucleic acid-binding protein
MNVITNTTVISNFASVGRLNLLRQLFGEVYLSTEVYAEIQDGLAEGHAFYAGIETQVHPLTPQGWLRLISLTGEAELRVFGQLMDSLHRGEAASLAIAVQRGWAFFSDDARARQIGRNLHVPVSGTLGVLLRAVKAQFVSLVEANALLDQMIQAGYRSPYTNLAELL